MYGLKKRVYLPYEYVMFSISVQISGYPVIYHIEAQLSFTASVRLCMGSRRGFICRMKMGNMQVDPMTANHSLRVRQHSTLGPSTDGNHYSIVHVTGYIKNWPPSGN